jgi:hypothetical protein
MRGRSGCSNAPRPTCSKERHEHIPALLAAVDGYGALAGKGSVPIRWSARKGEGVYDPEVPGTTVKKTHVRTKSIPVLKLCCFTYTMM